MHTVSLFPAFFDYQFLGVFLLRVALGIIFIHLWYRHSMGSHTNRKYFNVVFPVLGITGALFVIGLYTQGAALVTGTLMSLAAFLKWRKSPTYLHEPTSFYILLAVISFTFIFFGAGAFAVDLPL